MATKTEIYEELVAERDALNERVLEAAGAMFAEKTAPLFARSDKVESIAWTQYTDHGSDGDPPSFTAYTDAGSLEINGEPVEDQDWYRATKYGKTGKTVLVKQHGRWNPVTRDYGTAGWVEEEEYGYIPNPDYDPELTALVEEFSDVLEEIGEDELLALFGDHVRVVVTADGAEVEDYEDRD